MKKTNLLAVLALAATPAFLHAQTNPPAYSDVVGYMKVSIPAGKASMVSFPLGSSAVVSGSISGKTGSNGLSTAVSLSSLPSNITNGSGEPLYYLELTSGSYKGLILDITAISSGVITVSDSSRISSGDTFNIKKFTTIADVFGANNSAGLLAGNDVSAADVIWLVVNGSWKSYYFYDDGFSGEIDPLQWQTPGSGNNQGDTRIDPDQGVLIVRRSGSDKTVTISGTVKSTPSFVPFVQGVQIVTNPLPKDSTLSSLSLKTGNSSTGFVEGNDVSTADVLYKLSDGAWKAYFVYNDGFDGEIDPIQWQTPGSQDNQGSVAISAGEAFLVVRKGVAFEWPVVGL